jgi:Fe-S-cluster containining protein
MPRKAESKREDNFFDVCSRCKTSFGCCLGTRPPITQQRRKTIEEYLRNRGSQPVNAFSETEYVFPRENLKGYCIFHDMKTRKCLIHSVKPETCVAGPITFDINRKTKKIEWHVKMEQICQLAGTVYNNKKALGQHLRSAKKEILTLVHELDAASLKAILKKDEPETFKIGEDTIEEEILDKLE